MTTATSRALKNPPLVIDSIRIPGIKGMIGITSCPGMRDEFVFDLYGENLVDDIESIRAWGASVVVTLLEELELNALGVKELGKQVVALNMIWMHLPIRNMGVPDEAASDKWRRVIYCLCDLLRKGQRVVIHCKEGIGRAGLFAASLLVSLGIPVEEAMRTVRKARPGSLSLAVHEKYCRALAEKSGASSAGRTVEPFFSREVA
jgi:protein-tyrosine phosphatase